MGKHLRGHVGQLFIRDHVTPSTEWVDDPRHLYRIPHHHGIGQQTEARGLVHDLVVVPLPTAWLAARGEASGGAVPMAYELAPDLYRISTERRSRISVWSDTPAPHPAPGTVGRPGR
jgi:hypothetical protein